jgi:hypothetical protein
MVLASVVLGILLTIAYQILVPCLHFWNINQRRAALEEDGLVLENRLQRDMQKSARESINFTQPPQQAVIGFMSVEQNGTNNPPFDPSSGETLWQRYVLYYQSPAHQALRKVWPDYHNGDAGLLGLPWNFPTYQPVPLTPAQLLQIAATPNGTEQCVASDVAGLWFQTSGAYLIQGFISLQASTSGGPQTSIRSFSFETRL